ncbi:MAG: hypothetical protein HY348_04930 [Nitrospira defluvii]|nr:hypothetical protein [Nitrospira defluvii]
MTERMFTTLSALGALYALLALGCGQPRVYVVTSTTVGLEATPPMSDGSGMPRVTFGYRRAELVVIPVCPVPKYEYKWLGFLDSLRPEIPNCPDDKVEVSSDPSTVDPRAEAGTGKDVDKDNRKGKPGGSSSPPASDQQDSLHQSSILAKGPGDQVKRQDAYSTLGLFRLGLSWFGPAKIEQFVATGQAAIALQDPPKPPQEDQFIRPEQKDQKNQPDTNKQVDDKKAKIPEKKPAPAPTGSSSAAPAPPALESQEGTVTGQPTAPSGQPNP